FESNSDNLAANDIMNGQDIFLHDLQTGSTVLVSVDSQGQQQPGNSTLPVISADGRFIAFESLAPLAPGDQNKAMPPTGSDIYVRDLQTGTTTRASSNPSGLSLHGDSHNPSLSADGRWLSFLSSASDFVAGDNNGKDDAFLLDRLTGHLELVSVLPD